MVRTSFLSSALLFTAALVTAATSLGCERNQGRPPNGPPQPSEEDPPFLQPRQAVPQPPPIAGAPAHLYRFPFHGRWRVQRTHYGGKQADQAYALDLIPDEKVRDRGSNAGYPCYNQPVLADAPGIVVVAVDGVPDNVPGKKNFYDAHGNYVVIDHQNGEYSLMAHLIPGSLKVRPGMAVQTGMELGRCGNTGNSDFPHIHWQVMDSLDACQARGLVPRYAPYSRNGKMSSELPERKDTLENK